LFNMSKTVTVIKFDITKMKNQFLLWTSEPPRLRTGAMLILK
jgi:hypothetical protein